MSSNDNFDALWDRLKQSVRERRIEDSIQTQPQTNSNSNSKTKMTATEEKAYKMIKDVIGAIIPKTDYLNAEHRAEAEDRKERERYGESSNTLEDLRWVKRYMLDEARSLAQNIANLHGHVYPDRPAPQSTDADEAIYAVLNDVRKALAELSIIKKSKANGR